MTRALASVVTAPGHTELRELPLPAVTADSGLLAIEAAGVCGSDVREYRRDGPARILGHENVGRIEGVGSAAARRWGVAEGDRVVLEEYLPCGHCPTCRTTDFRLCTASDPVAGGIRYGSTALSQAPGLWGGYSQYLYLHPNSVIHRAPSEVPAKLLALTLPVSNGYQWACVEGGAGPGTSVVILGPGQQGLACTLAAKIAGADRVVVTGLRRDAHRLRVAQSLGADVTVDLEDDGARQHLLDETLRGQVDLVIDTASGGTDALAMAADLLTIRGTLLLSTAPERVDDVPMKALQWKCATVKGVRGHSYAAVEWALDVISSRRYPLHEMCTHTFGLSDVDSAIRATAGEPEFGGIHVSIDPWVAPAKQPAPSGDSAGRGQP